MYPTYKSLLDVYRALVGACPTQTMADRSSRAARAKHFILSYSKFRAVFSVGRSSNIPEMLKKATQSSVKLSVGDTLPKSQKAALKKLWTRHKLHHAQARAFSEGWNTFTPFELTIPGIASTQGYTIRSSRNSNSHRAFTYRVMSSALLLSTARPK
jgi:hypothetical protein